MRTPHEHWSSHETNYPEKLREMALEISLQDEEEHRRLSDAIHDDAIQSLAACKMRLSLLSRQGASEETEGALQSVVNEMDEVIQRLRLVSFELSPAVLYKFGLPVAVEWLAERMAERHVYEVAVDNRVEDLNLPRRTAVTLYRALRELLDNIGRAGWATGVKVVLDTAGKSLLVDVQDDGVGFDPAVIERTGADGGYGVFNLRERVVGLDGRLIVESAPGAGARFLMLVPVG